MDRWDPERFYCLWVYTDVHVHLSAMRLPLTGEVHYIKFLWVKYVGQKVNMLFLKLMCWKQEKWANVRIWLTLMWANLWWLDNRVKASPKIQVFGVPGLQWFLRVKSGLTKSWAPKAHWYRRKTSLICPIPQKSFSSTNCRGGKKSKCWFDRSVRTQSASQLVITSQSAQSEPCQPPEVTTMGTCMFTF